MDELLWCCNASSRGRYRRCYTITTNSQNTHHVPTHVDARGALELGLLRSGRIDHLHEDEDHYERWVRLVGLHSGEICKMSRKIQPSLHSSVDNIIAYCTACTPDSRRTPRASQRHSSGAHVCANAAMSYM